MWSFGMLHMLHFVSILMPDIVLQSVYFKVRKLAPCILAGLQINVELPEEDELQISLLGMVLGEGNPAQSVQGGSQSGTLDVPFKKSKQGKEELLATNMFDCNTCRFCAFTIFFRKNFHQLPSIFHILLMFLFQMMGNWYSKWRNFYPPVMIVQSISLQLTQPRISWCPSNPHHQ